MFARAYSSRLHALQLHRNAAEDLQQHGIALTVNLHDGTALNVQVRALVRALSPASSRTLSPPSHSGHVSRVLCPCSPTRCTARLRNARELADVHTTRPSVFTALFACFFFFFVFFSSVVSAQLALPLQALKPRLLYEVRLPSCTFTCVSFTSRALLPGTAKL